MRVYQHLFAQLSGSQAPLDPVSDPRFYLVRKDLVLRVENDSTISRTQVGRVIQLLYRGSCFLVLFFSFHTLTFYFAISPSYSLVEMLFFVKCIL